VSISTAGLKPGTYTTTITIIASDGTVVTIPITLIINWDIATNPFEIKLSQNSLSVKQGRLATISIPVTSSQGFADVVNISVSGLPIGAYSLSATSGVPNFTSILTVNTSALSIGEHLITIYAKSGPLSTATIFSLYVYATGASSVIINPSSMFGTSMIFSSMQGTAPPFQSFTITNTGGTQINWTATKPANATWLIINQTSGTLNPGQSAVVSVSISTVGLKTGTYRTIITVATSDGIVSTIPVIFTYLSGFESGNEYDYELDPTLMSSTLVSGNRTRITFKARNMGIKADQYSIVESLSERWPMTVSVDGISLRRTFSLSPEEEALITIDITVPEGTSIGTMATLILNVSSMFGGKSKVTRHTFRVETRANNAPTVSLAFHTPALPLLGQDVTFSATIFDIDDDPLSEARVCKSKDCAQIWCSFPVLNKVSGSFNCTVRPPMGEWSYFIRATDVRGASSSSDTRKFTVTIRNSTAKSNVAGNATIRASSSIPGYGAENAIDGNFDTYWRSGMGLPQSLVIDLGKNKSISGFGIFSEDPARPVTLALDVSTDCTAYKRVYDERYARYSKNGSYIASFSPVLLRCARFTFEESSDKSDYVAIGEIELYSTEKVSEKEEESSMQLAGDNTIILIFISVLVLLPVLAAAYVFRDRLLLRLSYIRG
jgi:hypothetical protein